MRMGKIYLACFLILAAAPGVFADGDWESDRNGKYRISEIGGFEGVVNTTAAEVVVRIGSEYAVTAKGDKQVLRSFTVDVRDEQLRIRNPWRPWFVLSMMRGRDVLFEVTTPELRSVKATGSGDVRVEDPVYCDELSLRTTGSGDLFIDDPVRCDALRLQTTGSGGITVEGDSNALEITISGSGEIDFSGNCEEAEIVLSGPGNLQADIETRVITARISGSGDIDAEGSAGDVQLRLSGPGLFLGDDFSADRAHVTISGSGSAVLAVMDELEAKLTGRGDLKLLGGSPDIDAKTTGSGRVVRAQ